MTLPLFAVGQGGCMGEEFQCSQKLRFRHYYLWSFLQVALSHNSPLRVLEVHINGIRGTTIHIRYCVNHDSTLFFYYLYLSSLPTVVHIIFDDFSFDITKLQKKKNCLDVSLTGSFPFSMSKDTHIHIPYHSYGDGDSSCI